MDHRASLRRVKKTLAQGHLVDEHPSQLPMENTYYTQSVINALSFEGQKIILAGLLIA